MSMPGNDSMALRGAQILARLDGFERPVGVEVGVWRGELSLVLLARSDLTLYLVDCWAPTPENSEYARTGDPHCGTTQAEHDECERATRATAASFGERARVMKGYSCDAALKFADASLDFVFLDADHSYSGVCADILAWAPKVKRGGILGGHDYDNLSYGQFGVKRAADALAYAMRAKLDLGDNYTWFVTL